MQQHAITGAWVMAGKVLAIVAGVAANAMLTRLLTPEEVGIYFLMISIATLAVMLGQAGQNQAVVRFVAGLRGQGRESEAGSVMLRAFMITSCGSILTALLYMLFVHGVGEVLFHSQLIVVGSVLMALWVVFNAWRSLAAECLRGLENIRLATLFEGLLTSLVFATLMGIVWVNHDSLSLHQAVVLTLSASLASMLFALFTVWRRAAPLAMRGPVGSGELLRTGLPLLGGNIVVVVMTSLGLWVVGYLASAPDAAIYGAAARVMLLAQFPLLALNAMLPPMIARMHAQGDVVEMERVVRLAASLALLVSCLVMLLFLGWGGELLGLLFGSFYADGKWVLVLLCVGVLGNAWAGFCGPVLMMTGHHDELVRMSLWAALVTLAATWLLGTRYGPEGVAMAMSIGMIVLHLLMWLGVRRYLGIWTHAGGLVAYARQTLVSR